MADTPGSTVRGEGTGLPADTVLLSPSVQGLLFKDETGAFVSGLADREGDWGWLPNDVPVAEGFDRLLADLEPLK
ncbi:MAG: hypothetical protein ACRCYU_14575 [Nocardioides sp.]